MRDLIRFAVGGVIAVAALAPWQAQAQSADGGNSIYQFRPGDTLNELARRYLRGPASAAEVQRINRIANDRRIPVGKRLVIPRRLLRSTPISLTLQSFSGPVTVLASGQRSAARAGLALNEGTLIETGANGFASIIASDGSRVSLPSNTQARFGMARRYLIDRSADIDVEILRGRSEVHAAPQNPGGNFRVRTPVAVSAVRGTEFRVGLGADGDRAFTEVLGGKVGVATPAREIGVDAGFGAASNKSGDIVSETLLPFPAVMQPGKVRTEELVEIAMQPVSGATGYGVQIARDAGFVDIIAEQSAAEPLVRFTDIANGTYFVRTSAVAPSGLSGLTEAWSIRRQRVGISAEAGHGSDPGLFRFAWSAQGEGTSLYRFQLFGPGSDAPLVDEPALRETAIGLTGLVPGAYRWRVGVIQTGPDGSAEVWSPLQRINISG